MVPHWGPIDASLKNRGGFIGLTIPQPFLLSLFLKGGFTSRYFIILDMDLNSIGHLKIPLWAL